jgi:hypothetical protein
MIEFIFGFIIGVVIAYVLFSYSCNCVNMKFISEKLIRQSARYGLASLNDDSPLISLLHANYSAGYWFSLKDILGDYVPDIDVLKYEAEIDKIQANATKKMVSACPYFVGNLSEDKYFLQLSGDSE